MSGRLVVVSGTGTGIGKTHFTQALLLALGRQGVRAAGIKPVETGFTDPETSDAHLLDQASSFHVKHHGVRFADPISPHVAAREAGAPIALLDLAKETASACSQADVIVAELAGGLFSPLTDAATNADLARLLRPDFLLLVAVDRLGVLHDLIAATRAAAAIPLAIDGIVLMAPETPDSSTGRNAAEVPILLRPPLLATVARQSVADLASTTTMAAVARRMGSG
jgi:dethiobiotin synthetase